MKLLKKLTATSTLSFASFYLKKQASCSSVSYCKTIGTKSVILLGVIGLISSPTLSMANSSSSSLPLLKAYDAHFSYVDSRLPQQNSFSSFGVDTTYPSRTLESNPYTLGYENLDHGNLSGENPEYTLPELGSGGNRFIEANKHKALGEWSLQQLAKSAPMLNDPWSQNELENIAWQINAQARSQAPLALVVIASNSINAFAIPGGVMGINTGTVIQSNSIDEVASVIAHEVAHLSQRHYEHRDEADRKALLLQIGGVLAAIAAASVDSDAATAVMMGSQTAALNSQMAFSRSNEREADRIGMQLMAKAGFDPKAMPKFFATLNQKAQLNMSNQTFLPSFIMTHPLSSERLSEAQSRANSYRSISIDNQRSQLKFELLKWRLKVLTSQVTETDLVSASPKNKGAALALAYLYGTQGRFSNAETIFEQLKALPAPNNYADKVAYDILMTITQAQVAGMQGKWRSAEQLLQPYHNLYPERRDITLLLAEAWLQQGQYNQVLNVLKPLVQSRPHDTESLFLIQRAYELIAQQPVLSNANSPTSPTSQADQISQETANIHALRYRAQGELWHGHYSDALVSLHQAKTLVQALISPLTNTDDSKDPTSIVKTSVVNPKPLMALVESEIANVKTARDINH